MKKDELNKLNVNGQRMMQAICYGLDLSEGDEESFIIYIFENWKKLITEKILKNKFRDSRLIGSPADWNHAHGFGYTWWSTGFSVWPYQKDLNDITNAINELILDNSYQFYLYDNQGRKVDFKMSSIDLIPSKEDGLFDKLRKDFEIK